MKRVSITVGVALAIFLLVWVLNGLFSGNIIEQIKSHYGGLVENPSMVMYVPLIALGVPIALWWAVKIIRKKK